MEGVLIGEREHHRICLGRGRRRTKRSQIKAWAGATPSVATRHHLGYNCCSQLILKISKHVRQNHCQPFHWHFWLTNSNNNFCFHLASQSSEKPLIVDKVSESPLPSDSWQGGSFQEPEESHYPLAGPGFHQIPESPLLTFSTGTFRSFSLKQWSFKGAKRHILINVFKKFKRYH